MGGEELGERSDVAEMEMVGMRIKSSRVCVCVCFASF